MNRCRDQANFLYAILALSGVACGAEAIAIVEPGPPSLAIAGVVTSQTGSPLAGAAIHSQAYEPDCMTPVTVERDTLLVADANGAFQGMLRALDTGAVCLRVFSTLEAKPSATQLVHGRFVIPAAGIQALDTAVVTLTIP